MRTETNQPDPRGGRAGWDALFRECSSGSDADGTEGLEADLGGVQGRLGRGRLLGIQGLLQAFQGLLAGALQVGGKTVSYYSLAGASLGFQAGAEKYDMIILFVTDEALKKFRASKGWEAGVDAEVTMIAQAEPPPLLRGRILIEDDD